jgi:hypothetical protein
MSAQPRLRGPVTVHPLLVGSRRYLRALRAAEMAAWEAGLPVSAVQLSETEVRAQVE